MKIEFATKGRLMSTVEGPAPPAVRGVSACEIKIVRVSAVMLDDVVRAIVKMSGRTGMRAMLIVGEAVASAALKANAVSAQRTVSV